MSKKVLFESIIIYILLLLGLVLLDKSYGIETRDETANEMNNTDNVVDNERDNLTLFLRQQSFTAGNTLCHEGNSCDFNQGTTYKWCYTNSRSDWDYCCTGTCDYHGKNYMWCESGSRWQYCGGSGNRDIEGRYCSETHPCGMHQESETNYFWCYSARADKLIFPATCCAPSSKCGKHGESYNWCYTGVEKNTGWQYCTPYE